MANEKWARQRVAELSPNEEIIHLVGCRHGEHNDGWLVATNQRIWWLTSGGLLRGGETQELSHGTKISTQNVPLSRVGVLLIGDEMFQMKKAQAEEYARVLRSARPAQFAAAPAPVATAASTSPPAGWHPDPCARHEVRYWDGQAWTAHVADQGVVAIDPV